MLALEESTLKCNLTRTIQTFIAVSVKRLPNKIRFHQHLKNSYRITLSNRRLAIVNPDIQPDIQNSNIYCKACETKYATSAGYRNRLNNVHDAKVSFYGMEILNPHIAPEINDPNFHWAACEKTFKRKYQYWSHLERIHKIFRDFPQQNSTEQPEINDNLYCSPCEKQCTNRSCYLMHLRRVHKMTIPTTCRPTINPNITPDYNDPNFFCAAYEKKFNQADRYHSHLRNVHEKIVPHRSTQSFIKHSDIPPDPRDPNFYCAACEKTYENKSKFYIHLYSVHAMSRLKRTETNPHLEPDAHDIKYCRTCDMTFKKNVYYRNHLKFVHKIFELPPPRKSSIVHHHLTPADINDPDFYCCACEKTLSKKVHFINHLKFIHDMAPSKQSKTRGKN